ncbi:hypothetical protein CBS147339_7691 [Penicillium roqueforti]|uniref:Uncharacterized protein n=1 Tax=Penicillium roqueforti (strain FM164) TaxID=1365484 RepID=W6QI94_PENRF|nr:uncharacterized protein LCP9604111_2747 [Penicillium roqueforti]CDM33904.1 Protein of unknown function DUF3292 [Penicillium roqueforti FM164]KAF9251346.1 hypothetical protein LCP9604111_2747 [Penicillium roqueforti]KAI2689270.1 hypothetical protein LCP963914a_2359 [Penicillium roqueforti]KAI2713592.1 hypothetical protein CBS147332_5332 [Penicillium roqueforti]KAI2716686.1 hypothetical protein CBS147354_6954 [Penicillium roqueforti]
MSATDRQAMPSASVDRATIKADNNLTTDPEIPEGPTDSHVLSQIKQDERGLAQKAGDTAEISNIGWDESPDVIEEPLVAGLSNEDLWMLIRRFDKQMYRVKAVPDVSLQKLDFTREDDDEFSPDKLRATIERFYTTVVVGLTNCIKHIARLRSWKEPRRTAAFCTVYVLSCLLDLLVPTMLVILLALVLYPPCRSLMFPPAPISLVNKDTGGVQKPKAGILGSEDSITGAPEKFKGEAAEQEASNLVASVASVAVGSAVGKHDQGVPDDAPLEDDVPDAMDIVANTADAQSAAHGKVPTDSHDKTRQPMKQSVMDIANSSMHVIGDITDTYEKMGNALSATTPFPRLSPRLRLATVLFPAFLASLMTSCYVFMKLSTLLIGLVFFGDPVIRRGVSYLNRRLPNWRKIIQLQNSLLKGIPTNAQLAITLLRIGEANASPLPPPPTSPDKVPSRPVSLNPEELTLGASNEEIKQAALVKPDDHVQAVEAPPAPEKSHKRTLGSSILGLFRETTASGVESKRGIDRLRAAIGSHHAKNRVGVLRDRGKRITPSGPVAFDARYKGKRGTAIIDSTKEPPLLYFTTDTPQNGDAKLENRKDGSVMFTMPVTEIQEMRKLGGMGWKGKLVVGWALHGKEVVDGLLIIGKMPGQSYQLTAMETRNQLFNRLIAIDGQVWASC